MPDLNDNEPNVLDTQDQNLNGQPAIPTDDRAPEWVRYLSESTARDRRNQEELQRLREENERLKAPPAPIEEPLVEGDVFNKPNEFLNRVKKEMADTVRPVNDFIAAQSRERDYAQLKRRVMSALEPNALAIFKRMEHMYDEHFLETNRNAPLTDGYISELTERFIGRIVTRNEGARYFGTVDNNGNNQPPAPSNTRNREINPPNIRPTPGSPNRGNTPNMPKEITADDPIFDENDRRLMREQKFTPSEWKRMKECSPEDSETVWYQIREERKERQKAAAGGKR